METEKDSQFFARPKETEKPVYSTREEARQAFKHLLKEKVWIICRNNSNWPLAIFQVIVHFGQAREGQKATVAQLKMDLPFMTYV